VFSKNPIIPERPMKISHAQIQGQRPYQEDRYIVYGEGDVTVIGVFDGHSGAEVADKAAKLIPTIYAMDSDFGVPIGIKNYFYELDRLLKDEIAGTTASIVQITPEMINIGIMGDSPVQALIPAEDGKDIRVIFPEHNVRSNQSEAAKVMALGGVIFQGYLFDYENGGLNAGIQMSRVLGDAKLRRVTIHEPEIFQMNPTPGTVILVASDGLVDPAHEHDSFVLRRGVTAQELVDSVEIPFDNVTAIVVEL
jgi:serine/threonine protein phosphatase PrpC